MKRSFFLVAASVLTFVTACSGSDDATTGSQKREYVDAIVVGLEKDSEGETDSFTSEESTCLAENLVEIIGVDAFVDANITPSELAENANAQMPEVSDDQHEELRAMLFDGDCVDLSSKIADSFSGSLGTGATEESVKCLADTIIKGEAMQNYMVDGLLGIDTSKAQTELTNVIMAAASDCGISGLGS